ncbi:MAG: glucose-1-phosphate cytidylyltransferase [Planctomycetota bacterium]|nr:MAG: glucose-1-phosphate cytidylyltransferase [Planctomycetota bacterium]
MKVAILAGGYGSRLAEETEIRPKPMVEIGNKPILWHIMQHYLGYGHEHFIVALGYKGEYIKRWFHDQARFGSDMHIDLRKGTVECPSGNGAVSRDWTVDLVDTGLSTNTGGRIKRLQPYLQDGSFCLTWGDGVSDIDLNELIAFHRAHGRLATVTAVRPSARYGRLDLDGQRVTRFSEKPQLETGWINGAFFVLEPGVFDYIEGDETQWEKGPMERLAADGELFAFLHGGFWQCMDTLREKKILQDLWDSGNAPWKTWNTTPAAQPQ